MRYTIEGFSQKAVMNLKREVIENGKKVTIKLDITDLVILRWFVDFFPKMKKYTEADTQYAWVHYDSILEDIPLLQIDKKPLYRRFKKMVSLGILTHKHVKVNGSFSYYGFGENYIKLIDDESEENSNPRTSESYPLELQNPTPRTSESYPLELKSPTKDKSINNNSSTKYSSTKREREEKKPQKRFSPPTPEEVKEYCKERKNNIDPEQFIAFYDSKGWKIGNSQMKNWKSAIITWEKRDEKKILNKKNNQGMANNERSYDIKEFKEYHVFSEIENYENTVGRL